MTRLLQTSRAVVLCLCALGADGAAQTAQVVPEPVAAPLFANARADVMRMEAESNEGRFEALTKLLSERKIAFEVHSFQITARKADPRTDGRNVVVTLPGRDPEILVGAHYDAVRMPNGILSRGAVDNGASVMVLARLAETLSRARRRNRVRIVFFDMEELGLLGSARYLQDHPQRTLRAMVNLDVNAFGDTLIFGPRTSSNQQVFRAMQLACAGVARTCVELPRMPPGDDLSFQKAGIPTVSMATVPELQAHQLWLLMNGGEDSGLAKGFTPQILRTIHTADDTSTLVDPVAMTQAYRAALAVITRLANER